MLAYHQLIENVALPMSDQLTHSKFWRLSKQVDRIRSRSQDYLTTLQTERLQTLFDVAENKTDFWAPRLRAVDHVTKPLQRLRAMRPVSKTELEAGFPDQIVNRSIDQSDLRFAATRGTTQRMVCVHDFAKRESMRAAMVCTLRASGYRVGMPMVEIPPNICDTVCGEQGERDEGVLPHLNEMVRSRSFKEASAWRDLRGLVERHWIYRRKTYPPFSPSFGSTQPDAELDKYIDLLNQDRPHTLKGLTTYLYQIAKRALVRTDVKLEVPVIRPLGSGATPVMRSAIEKAFRGHFHDDYGSAELGPVAFACHAGAGMHIFADQFIVEVVDQDGSHVPQGELGEIVITDLINHAMPLFRYRVGDLGRIVDSPCACGNAAPRIEIEGRIHDSVLDAEGRRVTSQQIANLMYSQPELDQFQLIEKRNGVLELTLVAKPDCEVETSKYQRLLANLVGEDRKLRIRNARTILPESGGKFRWVKALSVTKR